MYVDEQQQRERISALVDGQLDGAALTHTVAWLASSGEARATWHAYHVFGDVLRNPDLAKCGEDQIFLERFRERLAQAGPTSTHGPEAVPVTVPAQEVVRHLPRGSVETVVAPQRAVQAANDATVRWRWLAAVASFMTVAVLGWHVGTVNTMQLVAANHNATLAIVSAAAPGAEPSVMLRDARLDDLLAAHRQFGAASVLQLPTGFLRNATFEPPAR